MCTRFFFPPTSLFPHIDMYIYLGIRTISSPLPSVRIYYLASTHTVYAYAIWAVYIIIYTPLRRCVYNAVSTETRVGIPIHITRASSERYAAVAADQRVKSTPETRSSLSPPPSPRNTEKIRGEWVARTGGAGRNGSDARRDGERVVEIEDL